MMHKRESEIVRIRSKSFLLNLRQLDVAYLVPGWARMNNKPAKCRPMHKDSTNGLLPAVTRVTLHGYFCAIITTKAERDAIFRVYRLGGDAIKNRSKWLEMLESFT